MTVSLQLLDSLPSLHGREFSAVKSSHRQLLADFSRVLNKLVKNRAVLDSELDSSEVAIKARFLSHYLNTHRNKALLAHLQGLVLDPLLSNIDLAIQSCSDREKPRFVSLLSGVFTLPQLQALGCSVSKQSFSSANRYLNQYGVGAPVPKPHSISLDRELDQSELDALYEFLTEHSNPASNRCSKVDGESVPTRYLDRTYAELHRMWVESHRGISASYFRKCVRSFRLFKPPHLRGTDMCSICHKGKIHFSRTRSQLATHQPGCSFRQFVEARILIHAPSVSRPQSELSQLIVDTSKFDDSSIPQCRCSQVRATSQQSLQSLLYYFHHSALKSQSRFTYQTAIDNLAHDECMITIDWKENISINRGPIELSQHYYQRTVRSVFGCLIVYRDSVSRSIKKHYVDVISESLSHDSISSYQQLQLAMLDHLPRLKHIKTLHVWSDQGPHFRSQEFLCNVLFVLPQTLLNHGLAAEVNHHFFIEAHGKSLVDAHFSQLSSWLKELCNREFISSTADLINGFQQCAQSHNRDENISMRFMHYQPACSNHSNAHYQNHITADPVPMEIDDDNAVPVSVHTALDSCALHQRFKGEGRTRCAREPFYRNTINLPKKSTRIFYHWKSETNPASVRLPNPQLASMIDPTAATTHTNTVSLSCSILPPAACTSSVTMKELRMSSSIETQAPIAFAARLQPGTVEFGSRKTSILKDRAQHFASLTM
jgi:hypothetical protein